MQGSDPQVRSLDVFASRASRIVMTLGFGTGALLVALSLVRLVKEGASVGPVVNLLAGLSNLGCFGWMGYYAWNVPILHFNPEEIRWHLMGSRRTRRMSVAEVTGFRWPYPGDLWIEGKAGTTWRMSMVGISRRDRERVREWLSYRWVDRGLVV